MPGSGLAEIGDDVKKAGYDVGPVSDVGDPVRVSVVMFSDGNEAEAKQVAGDVSKQLGKTEVEKMTERGQGPGSGRERRDRDRPGRLRSDG